jgi:acyl-CoA thioester hydrolase
MQNVREDADFVDTEIIVRYGETDKMGVVYYANYLVWFEVGRVSWCRAKGFRYRDMEAQYGRFMMVAEAKCRYLAPARFEEDILIRTAVGRSTDRIIRFEYLIQNKLTGQLLARGETVHVLTDTQCRPARLPDHYRHYFGLLPRSSGRKTFAGDLG